MPLKRRIAALSTLAALVAVVLLGLGVWATTALVERAVERDAGRRSAEWARYAAENLPRIGEIAAGSPPNAEEWRTIERMAQFGGVFRFKVFSPEGVLRFESDDPTAQGTSLGTHNAVAAGVIERGEAYTVVADGRSKPNRPDLYSETYLPITDDSGRVVAIAETYLDQTEKTRAVRNEYLLFGSIMVGLILLALTGPSLALLALLRRLRARNADLDAARLRAQAADRAKTQFLATISHELRTPMNGIIGVVQLLETADLDAEDAELLDILRTCSESQMALIEEILTFGALEAGRMRLSEDVVDLAAAMKAATGFAVIAAGEKGIAFDLHVPHGTPAIVADANRLQQIVVNLVGNAVKFTQAGRVELRADLAATDDARMGRLRITVADTGPGIPPCQRERIFDRFTQMDGSSTRRAGGTGLGLAIARGIARAMDGDITVESTPGEGTTFLLEVPVPIAAQAEHITTEGRVAA